MLIRIIKTVNLSNVGTFTPGMVANIPRDVADRWIQNGDAMFFDRKPWVAPPGVREIPEGMFWCEKHQCLHKEGSKPGKVCQKRIDEEAEAKEEEVAAAAAAKAEAKAQAEETGGGTVGGEEESSESED